jgi:hypothetical protein
VTGIESTEQCNSKYFPSPPDITDDRLRVQYVARRCVALAYGVLEYPLSLPYRAARNRSGGPPAITAESVFRSIFYPTDHPCVRFLGCGLSSLDRTNSFCKDISALSVRADRLKFGTARNNVQAYPRILYIHLVRAATILLKYVADFRCWIVDENTMAPVAWRIELYVCRSLTLRRARLPTVISWALPSA